MTRHGESRRTTLRKKRRVLLRLVFLLLLFTALVLLQWNCMIRMPGKSYRGPLPALSARESSLAVCLRERVTTLAGTIGERNVLRHGSLEDAARFIEESLARAGYAVERQGYEVRGVTCHNLEAEVPGTDRADEVVVVGAHYDSVLGCPGANDNASGVAALLALAEQFAGRRGARTLRLVAFVNEEPPFFQTARMGSRVYARACRRRGDNVVAMVSLETIGYYSDAKGSQHYPFPFGLLYPSTGDFIGFVGNVSSRALVRTVVGSFRRHARFPSEGGALPGMIPGVGWSDHWAFWKEGYPAVMVTDTAPFRYSHYHTARDTPDKLDYECMARVVASLEGVILDLVNPAEQPH